MLDSVDTPETAARRVAQDQSALSDALTTLKVRAKAAPATMLPAAVTRHAGHALEIARANLLPLGLIAGGTLWLAVGAMSRREGDVSREDPLMRWGDESPAVPQETDVDHARRPGMIDRLVRGARRVTQRAPGLRSVAPTVGAPPFAAVAGLAAGAALALKVPASPTEKAALRQVTMAMMAALVRSMAQAVAAPRRM